MAHVHALKIDGNLGTDWTESTGGDGTADTDVTGAVASFEVDSASGETFAGMFSAASTWDLRCSVIQGKVTVSEDGRFEITVDFGSDNRVRMFKDYGAADLICQKKEGAGDIEVASPVYNASTMAWWRMRMFGSTVFYDTSADGLTWTNQGSTTLAFTPSAGTVEVYLAADGGDAATATLEEFNIPDAPLVLAATASGTTGAPGRTGDGNVTVSFPTNYVPVADDLSVLIGYHDQGDASTPSGYTEPTGSPMGSATPKLTVFQDLLAGGESAPVGTISGSTTNISHCFVHLIIWGATDGIRLIGTADAGTGSPMTSQAITAIDNELVLFACGRGDNESSSGQTFDASGTGVTELCDSGTGQGNDSQVSVAQKYFAAGASTGAGASTTSATDPWVGVMIGVPFEIPAAGNIPKFFDHYRKMMAA